MSTFTEDPIADAVISSAMGDAISQAFDGVPKRAGLALGRTEHQGRSYARGDTSNPVYRVAQLIRKSSNPMAIISSLLAVAAKRMTRGLSKRQLAHEWVMAHEAEATYQGLGDVKEAEWPRTGDIEAIYLADLREVSASLRRMALTLACQAKGVDPRSALPGGGS